MFLVGGWIESLAKASESKKQCDHYGCLILQIALPDIETVECHDIFQPIYQTQDGPTVNDVLSPLIVPSS